MVIKHTCIHNGTQREEECPPMWKPSPLLLQTIKVTINHKLVPLWVQIRKRETKKSVRIVKAALFPAVRLENVEASKTLLKF